MAYLKKISWHSGENCIKPKRIGYLGNKFISFLENRFGHTPKCSINIMLTAAVYMLKRQNS